MLELLDDFNKRFNEFDEFSKMTKSQLWPPRKKFAYQALFIFEFDVILYAFWEVILQRPGQPCNIHNQKNIIRMLCKIICSKLCYAKDSYKKQLGYGNQQTVDSCSERKAFDKWNICDENNFQFSNRRFRKSKKYKG